MYWYTVAANEVASSRGYPTCRHTECIYAAAAAVIMHVLDIYQSLFCTLCVCVLCTPWMATSRTLHDILLQGRICSRVEVKCVSSNQAVLLMIFS